MQDTEHNVFNLLTRCQSMINAAQGAAVDSLTYREQLSNAEAEIASLRQENADLNQQIERIISEHNVALSDFATLCSNLTNELTQLKSLAATAATVVTSEPTNHQHSHLDDLIATFQQETIALSQARADAAAAAAAAAAATARADAADAHAANLESTLFEARRLLAHERATTDALRHEIFARDATQKTEVEALKAEHAAALATLKASMLQ